MYKLGNIPEMENYAYYFGLIADKNAKQPDTSSGDAPNGASSMMQQQNKKDGTGDGEEFQPDENGDIDGTSEIDGEGEGSKIVTAANCGGKLTDHNWEAGNDAEDAAAAVRELVNSAVDMMNEESRGLMPATFMSQVNEINKPAELSWQAILKKYVGTIAANKRKTRMRLNRRQPERFDLSGRVDDKILKIAVAIDTSGSVDDEMIAKIFNEIFEILAKRKHEITVIECDADVQRVYKARNKSEIQKKVMGRGGTWFSPVIDYVNNDKYFRDALLIYFTDGYGEREIPKPRTYRNIWVVFGGAKNLSLKDPYGIVLSL
jgi:predicted metal-dependent peptidase